MGCKSKNSHTCRSDQHFSIRNPTWRITVKIKFNSGLDISDICPVYYTCVVFDKRPCFFLLYVPAAPFVPATAAAVMSGPQYSRTSKHLLLLQHMAWDRHPVQSLKALLRNGQAGMVSLYALKPHKIRSTKHESSSFSAG